MTWQKVSTKEKPKDNEDVLCAWELTVMPRMFSYAVLTHYPDGTWADERGYDVTKSNLPDLWQPIIQPDGE